MKCDVILSLFVSKLGLLFYLCFGFKYKKLYFFNIEERGYF